MPPHPELPLFLRRWCVVIVVTGALCSVLGCFGKAGDDEPASLPPPTLRLIVLGDEELAKSIEREWHAGERGELDLKVASASELHEMRRLPGDVIVYPSGMIGELAEKRLITALPDWTAGDEQLSRTDWLPHLRTVETMWAQQAVAVPLGSPQLAVLYRKDVLTALDKSPPATWREFNNLCEQIRQAPNVQDLPKAASAEWQVCAQPLAKGWAGQILLSRAAAYARDADRYTALFDYKTMAPLIDRPPFTRALEELVRTASPDSLDDTPASVRQKLLGGKCALAVTWPTRLVDSPESAQRLELSLGCFEMPGSGEVYNFDDDTWQQRPQPLSVPLLAIDGYLASVTTSARHTRSAAEALVWLAGRETGKSIVGVNPHCTMYRNSHIAAATGWISSEFGSDVALEYAAALQKAHNRPLAICSPRIPGRDEYLAALDDAVRTAVTGEKTPQVALADAAALWREITEERGVEAQKLAYMHSLGLKP